MFVALLQFFLCSAGLTVAGIYLTKNAEIIGENTRLGSALAGMILLAGATSLPELAIGLVAAWKDLPNVVAGGVFGSNLFNLGILGVVDLMFRSRGRMLSRSSAAHALSGCISMTLVATAALGILAKDQVQMGGLSISALALIGVYVMGIRFVYYDAQYQKAAEQSPTETERPAGKRPTQALKAAYWRYFGAAAVIFFLAPFITSAAESIANLSGLGESFVGTSFVGMASSMPELITTITALKAGSVALAVGNIFGSNSFNMVIFAVSDLAYQGSLAAASAAVHGVTALAVIIVSTVVIVGQLYHVEKKFKFFEPDALLVLVLVVGALILIYFQPLA